MIEQIPNLPAGTLGFRVTGTVTAADYENVLVPDIEAAFAINRKLRLLYHVAPGFESFEAGAMWDDAKLGFRHFSGWDRVALVTDVAWLRGLTGAMKIFVPADLRLFADADLEKAKAWIAEQPWDGGQE